MELLQAVNVLQAHEHDPNVAFPIICSTKATTAGNTEIANMEDLSELALVIFDKIASGSPNGVKNLYSADALAEYSKIIGSPVDSGQVQGMTNRMVELNFIQRLGHGTFTPAALRSENRNIPLPAGGLNAGIGKRPSPMNHTGF